MAPAPNREALVLGFFKDLNDSGELTRADDQVAKVLWQIACRYAYRGLNAEERELVRTFVAQRGCNHLLLEPVLLSRGKILSEAYGAVGPRVFTGHVHRVCGWQWRPYAPPVEDGHTRYEIRMETYARPGLQRWLGRVPEMLWVRPWISEEDTWTDLYKRYAFIRVDPFWLRLVALRGLHAPPPSSQVYPVMARGEQRLQSGVWIAEARWIHRRTRGESTYGWIAWCYEPGSRGTATKPPVVEYLVQGRSADGALKWFWQVYEAKHGRGVTPAARDLIYEQLAQATKDLSASLEPEEEMSDEDFYALAGLVD